MISIPISAVTGIPAFQYGVSDNGDPPSSTDEANVAGGLPAIAFALKHILRHPVTHWAAA